MTHDSSAQQATGVELSGYRVWARVAWMAIEVSQSAGVDLCGVFDGLDVDADTIRQREYLDWNVFTVICDRLTDRAGGIDTMGKNLEGNLMIPEFRHLVGSLVSPMLFSRVMQDMVMPAAFQGCEFDFKPLSDTRFRIKVSLRPGARRSWSWFCGYVYGLRCAPQHLGLPPAHVDGSFDDSVGEYFVTLPQSRSVVSRVARLCDRLLLPLIVGRGNDGTLTAATFGNTQGTIELRIAEAAAKWGLTERQLLVLKRLATGESNKEIAAGLECAENTIEFHVTQLLKKASVTSRTQLIAIFWRGAPSEPWHVSTEGIQSYLDVQSQAGD